MLKELKPSIIVGSNADDNAMLKKRSKLRLRGDVPKENRKPLIKMTHENFAHIGVNNDIQSAGRVVLSIEYKFALEHASHVQGKRIHH